MLGAIWNKNFYFLEKNYFLPLGVPFGPLIEESYSV